jgi:8-oxo-dGTP pyrophosphatase MutT (NUDIX family)
VTALHDDALSTLRRWVAPDERQERLRQEYVDHLDGHVDGLSRTDVPDHLTAGALVLSADHRRVLLTLHAKAREWFHLGGHCEPADSILAGAALREATEESGIDGLVLDPEPVHLDRHDVGFCGPHEHVRHLDVRFLALAPADAVPSVSAESLDVRWWPVDALPTDAPDMRRLVELALDRVRAAEQGPSGARPPGQQSSAAS